MGGDLRRLRIMGRFCIERRGKKKRRKGQRGKGAKNPNTTHTTPKKMASSDEDSDIETGLSRYDDNSDEELNQEELLEMDAVFGLRDRQDMEKKPTRNNKKRMLEKLEEIKLGKAQGYDELPWDTLQVVTSEKSLQEELKGQAEDDFTRETAIVDQALEAADIGYAQLKKMKIPYVRPNDYFAEMVKTDDHMDRVRKKLLAEKAKVEGIEERRRVREMKKYGKEIQRQKEKERLEQKKSTLEAVKQWKRDGGGDMDDGFLDSIDQKKGGSSSSSGKQGVSRKRKSAKQQAKDDKYGYGGPKKRAKKNTAESTDSMQGFSNRRNKSVPSDLAHRLPKGSKQRQQAAPKKRPGKNRRRNG